MLRLVIIVLALIVGVNWLYDGKLGEFIGNALHTWQTGETKEQRLAREERRRLLEQRYAQVEACPALRDFARDVDTESVQWRGMQAEVVLANVKKHPDRDMVSDYLAAFEKLAFKDSREFDRELRRIVRSYCE